MLCAIINQTPLNGEGVYVLRQCLQVIIVGALFQRVLCNSTVSEVKKSKKFFIIVLTLPSLVILLQSIDLFGLKPLMDKLYSPVYFLETLEQRAGYRVTSVFKDSFIASVYLIVAYSTILNIHLVTKSSKADGVIGLLALFVIFVSAFKVGRTALVFIPLVTLIVLYINRQTVGIIKTINYTALLILILITSVVLFAVFTSSNSESFEWVSELLNIFNPEGFSSYNVMHDMNEDVLAYVYNNPYILLLPLNYTPDSYFQAHMYSDNFYMQELLRYGIYGLASYFLFLYSLLKHNYIMGVWFNLVIIVLLALLNYKGGNTFLLAKASLIYPFVFLYSHYFYREKEHG